MSLQKGFLGKQCGAVAIVALALLAGCTGTQTTNRIGTETPVSIKEMRENSDWVSFGPFLKPALFANTPDLSGPSELFVDTLGPVRLDATELLAGQIPEPFEVLNETYSYTFDYDRGVPMVAGVAQVMGPGSSRDAEPTEVMQTWVFGVDISALPDNESYVSSSAGAEVRIASCVFSGPDHTATLAGRSDLGVIAVQLESKEEMELGVTERLVGVDVVRATEVWFKEHGAAFYGDELAVYAQFEVGQTCASSLATYEVASGVVVSTQTRPESPPQICH